MNHTNVHLRVVGTILENHKLYQQPRLDAVKSIVLQVIAQAEEPTINLQEIQEILCIENTPLVRETVLRQALNSLNDEGQIKLIDRRQRIYKLVVEVPTVQNTLEEAIINCWKRNFTTCSDIGIQHFQKVLALLFARYGCEAYETLTSQPSSSIRFDEIFESIDLPEELLHSFRECFVEFVLSHNPADAQLKVSLASSYALLRMNGAGNWDRDELQSFFKDKRLLIDTNILFEIIGRNVNQILKLIEKINEMGGSLVIGQETIREFEFSLRKNADQIVDLVQKGVDLPSLISNHVVRADWVRELFNHDSFPSRDDVFGKVENILAYVDDFLNKSSVTRVHLDRDGDTPVRQERLKLIQQFAIEIRKYEKHEEVATHDVLLWEALEETPTLADLILSQDRILGRLQIAGDRAAIMLDEIVAYALMGGAEEEELADIFSYTLTLDIYPEAAFLDISDLHAIAGMEATLLNGPPRALRRAAKQLSEVRSKRLSSGQPVNDDEVGRILVSSISTYRDDRVIAEQEREKRLKVEEDSANLRGDLANLENRLEKAESTASHVASLEENLNTVQQERASLQADLEEVRKRQESSVKKEEEDNTRYKKQRDWMLFSAFFVLFVGLPLILAGFQFAAGASIICAFLILLWTSLSQETPSISLRLVSLVIAVVVSATGIIEKWSQIQPVLSKLIQEPKEESSDETKLNN